MSNPLRSGPSTLMGIRVIESPLIQPVPRIQVRDIKLRDGTSILGRDFLARENQWWRDRFGTMEVAYLFQWPFQGIAMNPKQVAMLKNFTL